MIKPIRIIHTNDLHSHFEMMPKIARFFKRRRETLGDRENLLFIDLGDHLDRSHPITEVSLGEYNRIVLEAMGYRWVTIGNNEGITLTKEDLNRLYEGSAFHVILSNLVDLGTGAPPRWAKPFEIVTAGNLRLGLIGLTASYQEYYRLLGWKVKTAEEVLPELIATLRPQVDMILLLSHLGLPHDRRIAANFPEIHLILGAHSHHFLPEGEWVGSTLITQMGKGGTHVGEVVIQPEEATFSPSSSSRFVMQAKAFSILNEERDREMDALILGAEKKAEERLKREVISLSNSLPVNWEDESPFANLLAQSVRLFTQADVSFVNAGLLLDSLPEGITTQKDLLRICPHPINPCVITLRALELKEIIEEALKPEKIRQRIRGYGFRGEILGFPSLDGCEVIVDGDMEKPRVVHLLMNGNPLSEETEIRLGTIDMLMFLKPYRVLQREYHPRFILPDFLRLLLATELNRENSIEEAWVPRFHRL